MDSYLIRFDQAGKDFLQVLRICKIDSAKKRNHADP